MPWRTHKFYKHLQMVRPGGEMYCSADGDLDDLHTDSDESPFVSSNYASTPSYEYESDESDEEFRSLYGFSLC